MRECARAYELHASIRSNSPSLYVTSQAAAKAKEEQESAAKAKAEAAKAAEKKKQDEAKAAAAKKKAGEWGEVPGLPHHTTASHKTLAERNGITPRTSYTT